MVNFRPVRRFLALALLGSPALFAQGPSLDRAPVDPPAAGRSAIDGSILTRKDARTITLKIPGPRGQIVDREGEPLAQSLVAYQIALQYKQFESPDRDFVVSWGRTRLNSLTGLVKGVAEVTDEELYDHYRNRRWLPLLVTGQIGEKEARQVEGRLGSGLILHPVYRRYYPHDELAAHLLGYTGSVGKLPTGPINFNEPLWEESEGRAGFEKIFDRQLAGEPGAKRLIFDEQGNKLQEEQVKRPRPGGTLVTTINLRWQKRAEEVLRKGAKRGAFVVLDVATGEVLVMASRPAFNPNDFIPGIRDAELKAMEDDPAQPLFGRAFQAGYPPASSFKPIVALSALNEGIVTEESEVYCPASIQIGNHTFRNWTTVPEGSIDVRRAIARSCNTWFYQVGIDVGPSKFLGLSRMLGFGERSGLPLIGETAGLVPNDEYMLRVQKRRILDGDSANMSIGQGDLLASPLQVAQAMAGIGNGGALPKLQLIRQIQDNRGRVVQASTPEKRHLLGLSPEAVEITRDGMRDVVNSGYGTGRRAGVSYTSVCGKTGTAQWGPKSKNQRLAWFAGFLPHDNPRYAFAVLYEGRPNETVSGGRMAAPMVHDFFEPLKDEIKDIIAPPMRALVVIDENAPEAPPATDVDGKPLRAIPVEPFEVDQGAMRNEPPPARAVPVNEDEDVNDGEPEP